ncbi:MAG: OmpA family protein [Bacteroidota bacterium]
MLKSFFYFLIISVFILQSCIVSKKVYDETLADKIATEAELQEKSEALEESKDRIASLNKRVEDLLADSTTTHQELAKVKSELEENKQRLGQLQKYYDDLIDNKANLDKDLEKQQRELLDIRKSLEVQRLKNEELLAEVNERSKRVDELENIIAQEKEAINRLKKRVSDALLSFKSDELQVEVKNGKVYVSLSEQLLFKSGSINIDAKGKDAIQKLAAVLKDNPDIGILVEGHTDNVPISVPSRYFRNNWDLSVLRATTISNILVESGVPAEQVTASGKGESSPVESNETAEGRQKNRRTEIILSPNLDELFEILGAE